DHRPRNFRRVVAFEEKAQTVESWEQEHQASCDGDTTSRPKEHDIDQHAKNNSCYSLHVNHIPLFAVSQPARRLVRCECRVGLAAFTLRTASSAGCTQPTRKSRPSLKTEVLDGLSRDLLPETEHATCVVWLTVVFVMCQQHCQLFVQTT